MSLTKKQICEDEKHIFFFFENSSKKINLLTFLGSNGDIEDNLDDHSKPDLSIQINDENSDILRGIKPFLPDPDRLDPHMEALCKKVRKFSVSTADPNADSLDNTSSVNKEYEVSDAEKEDEKHFLRLQNDWIARSLTSIGNVQLYFMTVLYTRWRFIYCFMNFSCLFTSQLFVCNLV